MAPKKKGAAKAKKSAKRKAPEPATDGAGPSNPLPVAAAQPAVDPSESQTPADALELRQKTALAMLLQLGIPEDRALRALNATADEHSNEAENWADEAGIWLAVDNECNDESYVMGIAMEESLADAEKRKAKEKLPMEQTGKEIVEKFIDSELLEAFRRGLVKLDNGPSGNDDKSSSKPSTSAGKTEKNEEKKRKLEDSNNDVAAKMFDPMVADSPLKKAIVGYLLMEQRCKKWYTCSRGYFANVAQQIETLLAKELNEGDKGFAVGQAHGDCLALLEPETLVNGQPLPPPPMGIVQARHSQDIIEILTKELEVLEEAVFKRPENEDQQGVPAIFAAYVAVQDEVIIVDD
jgi:hypothetical protein